MKNTEKSLIGAEQSAGRLPVTAPGVPLDLFFMGSPTPGFCPLPQVALGPIKAFTRFGKVAIDLAQGKNPVAILKRSTGKYQLQLPPLGQRLLVAIDESAFAVQMPENILFLPDVQVLIDAIRIHWLGRDPAFVLTSAAAHSVANPVEMAQVLNAIADFVRAELTKSAAMKRRLMHELMAPQRTRGIREALQPAIPCGDEVVHVLQADLYVVSSVYGQDDEDAVEAQNLKAYGQTFVKQVRVHFGSAVVASLLDHCRLLAGHSLHMAVFLVGPGLDELESIRQELSGLWARCTAGRGVMTHTSVSHSPFYFRGLPPEEGALLSAKQNLARVAAFIGYREHYMRDATYSSLSDRLIIDLTSWGKGKGKKPFLLQQEVMPEMAADLA